MIRHAALAAVALCACARHEPLDDCAGDLAGVWRDGAGHRYDVIAGGADTWEMYPMFDDRPTELPAGIALGPSVLDLPRGQPSGDGKLTRRFERGSATCGIQTVVHLHDCQGDRVALDVAEPLVPLDLTCPTGGAKAADGARPAETWSLARE